ncbi:hypothetical protein H6F88_28670 [Oculatella sp. FACHB-28]|uniref:hypothetical protein n=1 Tax=Oculatella sp. FACHB-28 TaxID=2692845 RepID=UPI0016843449|nr:hypothetical protein [Oculatella sp. FACHB-28]MBD2059917.1 hypothetical protein [Oculatella sp. FACHB-28]
MLVFFIHGVGTKNASYADHLIRNTKSELFRQCTEQPVNFYSSFWGNLFNNKKHQVVEYLDKDISRFCTNHPEYEDYCSRIYRYKQRREKLINNFLGDFLIYQNPKRGKMIRSAILEQFNQFLKDHPESQEIHFVAHSLGSFILWDLLFSDDLDSNDPAYLLREKLDQIELASITTLGSPLLFLKQMFDLDFSAIATHLAKPKKANLESSCKLRWVNVIHSSDLVAYPLHAAIEKEISSELFFCDQYVWEYANPTEQTLLYLDRVDLAMVVAAEDAHSAYFYDNSDGAITAKILTQNLLDETKKLRERCVHPR